MSTVPIIVRGQCAPPQTLRSSGGNPAALPFQFMIRQRSDDDPGLIVSTATRTRMSLANVFRSGLLHFMLLI